MSDTAGLVMGGVGLLVALSPVLFFSQWWDRVLNRYFPVDMDDDWPGDVR